MKLPLTVITPEADYEDTTNLAIILGWIEGWQPDEWANAFSTRYLDEFGNFYRVMSCLVAPTFVSSALTMGPVERPEYDIEPYRINLTGALRAQAKLTIWQPGNSTPSMPSANVIAAVGMPGLAVLDALKLVKAVS